MLEILSDQLILFYSLLMQITTSISCLSSVPTFPNHARDYHLSFSPEAGFPAMPFTTPPLPLHSLCLSLSFVTPRFPLSGEYIHFLTIANLFIKPLNNTSLIPNIFLKFQSSFLSHPDFSCK
jgi:hypothetical protein